MQWIDIVFDVDNPGGYAFISIEDETGHETKCGKWIDKTDGVKVLRIRPTDIDSLEPPSPPGWEGGIVDNH